MTNHKPTEDETFIKRKGKSFKIVSWKDEYKRLKKLRKNKKQAEKK